LRFVADINMRPYIDLSAQLCSCGLIFICITDDKMKV